MKLRHRYRLYVVITDEDGPYWERESSLTAGRRPASLSAVMRHVRQQRVPQFPSNVISFEAREV